MERVRKPEWLKISIGANERYTETKRIVESHCLHTICSSGRCPNMGECWGRGTATFMIGGNICTRSCKFCNTQTGRPLPLDPQEPTHVAESVRLMKLSHAVVTSVDRDDGTDHPRDTPSEPRNHHRGADPRLPGAQRTGGTGHRSTTRHHQPQHGDRAPHQPLGAQRRPLRHEPRGHSPVGETPAEVEELMDDLRAAGCQIMTIGQYLQPSHRHYPVAAYVTPEQFKR